jgi:hypothetical protein
MARSTRSSKLRRRESRAAKTVRRASPQPEPIAWSPPALLYERTPGAANAPLVPDAIYRRREPEQTALYRVVEDNLETTLADARLRTAHGYGYPRFVEQTLRDYLACGRRELGFSRVRCGDCGYELLLAFSCKRRGLCPSCEGRRMADTAAHLVDRVLPAVPYRQWVLSLPIPVRLLLLREPALVTPTLRIFVRRIFAWTRRIARGMGIADGRCAAVTFIQRAGGALNANVHFHTVCADGVFDAARRRQRALRAGARSVRRRGRGDLRPGRTARAPAGSERGRRAVGG